MNQLNKPDMVAHVLVTRDLVMNDSHTYHLAPPYIAETLITEIL